MLSGPCGERQSITSTLVDDDNLISESEEHNLSISKEEESVAAFLGVADAPGG